MSRNDRPLAHQSVSLDIEGMKCGGCVQSVERILLEQPSVA
ncbi:MAG TPA: heavy metal-associated domain-containing protein, partial [Prochlorococcus sp.]|nr:heavy metal-associated domain-containing protein [Prochlorococcus sp.]